MAERLWAPWRLQYIEKAEHADGCIFCTAPAAGDDAAALILHRGNTGYIILNRFPYSNAHLMVTTFKHTAELDDLSDEELLESQQLVRLSVRLLKAAYAPHGFNLGANLGRVAGAGVDGHVHWHIVPRWNGDTNFMPVLADIHVIPDSLEETYRRLSDQLARMLTPQL